MLKFYQLVCPFWDPLLVYECTVAKPKEEGCSFNYASERFLNCPHYLNKLQGNLAKHKRRL